MTDLDSVETGNTRTELASTTQSHSSEPRVKLIHTSKLMLSIGSRPFREYDPFLEFSCAESSTARRKTAKGKTRKKRGKPSVLQT